MRVFVCAFLLLTCGQATFAEELRWQATPPDYGTSEAVPHHAWFLSPGSRTLAEALQDIPMQGDHSRISHMYLPGLYLRPDIQKEVLRWLEQQPYWKNTPSLAQGKIPAREMARMRALLGEALLNTTLTREINAALAPRNKKVQKVSMEKLTLTKESDELKWSATIWLIIDEAPVSKPAERVK